MYRKILLTAVLAASFVAPAFAATTAKPAPAKFYIEMVGGLCSVTPTAVTPAPILTAPDKLEGSKTGYATLKAANSELSKLVAAKTCKTG